MFLNLRKFFLFYFLVIYWGSYAEGKNDRDSTKQEVRIIWVNKFKEQLGRSDTLSIFGDAFLIFTLKPMCEELCRIYNLSLNSEKDFSTQGSASEDLSKVTKENVQIEDISGKDVVYGIITGYVRTGNKYIITSTINKPIKGSHGKNMGWGPAEYTAQDEINCKKDEETTIILESIARLANQLTECLLKIFDMEREMWRIYPRPIKGLPDSLLNRWKGTPKYLLTQLVTQNAMLLEETDEDSVVSAYLNVELTSNPSDTTQLLIKAEIKPAKGIKKSIPMAAFNTFYTNRSGTFEDAIKALVEDLSKKLNKAVHIYSIKRGSP